MINTNELRIGNLIKYTGKPYPAYPLDNGIVEVEEILQGGVNLSMGDSILYDSKEIEGIPLTPEWLERMGFNRIDHVDGYSFFAKKQCCIFIYENKTKLWGHYSRPTKYVHQLQNLYFALTGEELTITEIA